MQILNDETTIEISSETFDWSKTIILKNKPLMSGNWTSITSIRINMNVTRCNLVKLKWNMEMPAEMPLLKNYDVVNGVPRWEINDEITEDKSHIVQKSMVDRFISEDPVNCPVVTYKIEKVMDSNNS